MSGPEGLIISLGKVQADLDELVKNIGDKYSECTALKHAITGTDSNFARNKAILERVSAEAATAEVRSPQPGSSSPDSDSNNVGNFHLEPRIQIAWAPFCKLHHTGT